MVRLWGHLALETIAGRLSDGSELLGGVFIAEAFLPNVLSCHFILIVSGHCLIVLLVGCLPMLA